MLGEEHRVESILEFYLFGGVSQYESFYAVPAHGNDASDPAGWHLHLNSGLLEQELAACNFSGELLHEFGADSSGETVFLGPYAQALRERDDLLERMRICVTAHDALPHEVAIPLAFSGRPLGHPGMAGLGAHIQRYFQSRDGNSNLPVSYVLEPGSEIVSELGAAAYATGLHPAHARPLRLVIEQIEQLYGLLERSTLGNRAVQHDSLVAANLERYQKRLLFRGSGEPVRSPRFGEALAGASAVALAPELRQLLQAEAGLGPVPGSVCDVETAVDQTTMSLQLGAHLLNSGARYVCVTANGILETPEAGGFDTHQQDCPMQARNVSHAMRELTRIIKTPSEAFDPLKIDLDKTLVIINTEFGRTPHLEGLQGGRGHWPYSYPVILLGGPMKRAIYGATDPGFNASLALSPVHHRIAALIALGIWPFEDESFNVSDVYGAPRENDAAQFIIDNVLGV